MHFGVDAGVPLTDTLSSSTQLSIVGVFSPGTGSTQPFSFDRYNSETKRLLIGPTFRVETSSGLGIEVDALYQRVDDDFTSAQFGTGQSFEATTANRWQFPVLVQYSRSLASWKARWFAEAGPSISHIGDSRSTISSSTISNGSTSSSTSSMAGPSATYAGITAGGGVDIPLFRIHLRPEFRYSHWFAQNGATVPMAIAGFLTATQIQTVLTTPNGFSFPIKQNEASFVLGLTF